MEEKEDRIYGYNDEVAMDACVVVAESYKLKIHALSTLNSRNTLERAEQLIAKTYKIKHTYLTEDYRLILKDASGQVYDFQKKALEELRMVRVQIKVYFKDADKVLDGLGFTALWDRAYSGKDQGALGKLLLTFGEHLHKYLPVFEKEGFDVEALKQLAGYGDKFTSIDSYQEIQKSETARMRQEAIKAFNDLYSEIIGICKIAQLFFIDDPVAHDMFVFKKVVERMNSTKRKKEKPEIIESES